MSYSILNNDGEVRVSTLCVEDSNIGFEADFSSNGQVNGWTYHNGIHTYGCWNNYLFGTIYKDQAIIGREETFIPVSAESFYTVKFAMKLSFIDRTPGQITPSRGKIMWRTLTNTVWAEDKELEFDLYQDSEWHTYSINMAEAQWWQGDINDIRIYIVSSDGRQGDRFLIRTIEIISVDTYRCNNTLCSYYNQFEHNCPGVGTRGQCKSQDLISTYIQGSRFDTAADITYTIEKGVNDLLKININGYGYENVQVAPAKNISGQTLANKIARELSKVDIGGYAECVLEYTGRGAFIVYSGTYADDSTVLVGNTLLARQLNFFNNSGVDVSVKVVGSNPATGFSPLSTFRAKTHQINSLMDSDKETEFFFNPYAYGIEAGRSDWLDLGLGKTTQDVQGTVESESGIGVRMYDQVDNVGKTIIDFNHPFNASGRITKIYAAVTLDTSYVRGTQDATRKASQLSGAKVLFFRPRRDGLLKVLPLELDIENRNYLSSRLYSANQEFVEIDCDILVNKGDYIGIYNANIYRGMSVTGQEIDALYYQIPGKPDLATVLDLGVPKGEGSGGLMIYARSAYQQKRLVLDIDLGKRLNVEGVNVLGRTRNDRLEYNIASCVDVGWNVDLFGGDYTTGYVYSYRPRMYRYYNHPSIAYGTSCLSDGIKIVPNGLASVGYSVNYGTYYDYYYDAIGKKNGGSDVILNDPTYFSVNGDCEWLGVYALAGQDCFVSGDFSEDPIAFSLTFPQNTSQVIHRSVIYFKEKYNFRNFAFSTYNGPNYVNGDADDARYTLLPNRTDDYSTPWQSITLDGLVYTPENENLWQEIDLYLSQNPCNGKANKITLPGGTWSSTDEVTGENDTQLSQTILNMAQYVQALSTDWSIIGHEWSPITCKGFRIYCDYHLSTKICEMELYSYMDSDESSLTGAVDVLYTAYEDYWTVGQTASNAEGVSVFIGDTPQNMQVVIRPISETYLSTISIDVSSSDVFMGLKGCETSVFPVETKLGNNVENAAKRIDFKNVYGSEYDLYVDIADDTGPSKDTIFYSTMSDADSISNPEIGPDAYYKKPEDYIFLNYNNNVAINCPVYKLTNLAHGTKVWFSHDNEYSWKSYGEIDEAEELSFSNLPNSTITILGLPRKVRSRWWKIGFLDGRVTTKVREMKIYRDGEEITDAIFYHHKGQDAYVTGNTDTAPHLKNNIIDGSYYILTGDQYIGIELPDVGVIDRVVLYHDVLDDIENSHNKGGVDRITGLLLRSEGLQLQTDEIRDYSYYEHGVQVVGSGIYNDISNWPVSYSFYEDFVGCGFSSSDWEERAAYSYNGIYSTYTCISGVCPTVSGGYARHFNFWSGAVYDTYNADGSYSQPEIFSPCKYPFDQNYAFTLRFVCQSGQALVNGGSHSDYYGFSVGLIEDRHRYYLAYSGWRYKEYCAGAQIAISRYRVRLVVQDDYGNTEETSGLDLNPQDNIHYYELYSDGNGNYGINVWSDGFDGTVALSETLSTSKKWTAYKIGLGSGEQAYNYRAALCDGWMGDVQFTCSKVESSAGLTGGSLRFSGHQDSYLLIDYENSETCNFVNNPLNFSNNYFCIDFRIRPHTLPENNGDIFWIVGSWHPDQPLTGAVIYPSSWLVYSKRISETTYYTYLIYNNSGVVSTITVGTHFFEINRWAHVYVGVGTYNGYWHPVFNVDGYTKILNSSYFNNIQVNITESAANLVVGRGFNGNIEELRISSDPYRYRQESFLEYSYLGSPSYDDRIAYVPYSAYERYYTYSIYDSADNTNYGKTMDVDTVFETETMEYEPYSSWSKGYYTYLVIDLGQRHDLDIIRSFPVDTAYQFSRTTNTLYSNKDTADPEVAFYFTEKELDVSTDFFGQEYSYPKNWTKDDYTNAESYITDNRFYQKIVSSGASAVSTASSDFYLLNDFDVSIDYDLGFGSISNENTWEVRMVFVDVNNSDNVVRFDRAYKYDGDRYIVYATDSYTIVANWLTSDTAGTMRVVRLGNVFKFYTKPIGSSVDAYTLGGYYQFSDFGIEVRIELQLVVWETEFPSIEVWRDNFNLNEGTPIFSTSQDARWVKVKMYNGDGVTRTIKRVGIYPDVTTLLTEDGKHNCKWEALGTAITSYTAGQNIALGATVSGSPHVGYMSPSNLTDGVVPEGDFNLCWGALDTDSAVSPWVEIVLPTIEQIYRVKIYHGYKEDDTYNLITAYKIYISEDAINYTTIFNITGNTAFSRTHDLTYPVSAKYIKFEVVSYNSITRSIITPAGDVRYWSGPVLREIEVYKYYGYTVIESEESPIIAIDLKQAYYIEDHEVLGVDSESTTTDWSNTDSNFTYANSNLSDPSKVAFRPWGSTPEYDRWVLVKRNTAIDFPTTSDDSDLLKHVIIKASTNEAGTAPNPIEHPWMWYSTVSTLTYNYNRLAVDSIVARSLQINYPATTDPDHVYFIEGDHFGWDEHVSFRDGFGFNVYISDIDNLDASYGYFYLGGYDYTSAENPIVHKWYFSSISGTLNTGWNNLHLSFKYSDELVYTQLSDGATGGDPRIPTSIKWSKMGIVFKGLGNPLTMNIDGCYIRRNHFEHGCYKGYGLYLHGDDFLKTNIADIDLNSSTFEFWIRPDWSWTGVGVYNDFFNRSLFHLGNTNNDIFGATVSSHGLDIYYGNVLKDFNIFNIDLSALPTRDVPFHLAFVVSNNGASISSDNSTIRLYINNILTAKSTTTWEVNDDKHYSFILGGQGMLGQKAKSSVSNTSSIDAVVGRIKIHNYCKTNFSDSIGTGSLDYSTNLYKPSNLIEISKDNLTFVKVGSDQLPFYFERVQPDTSIPVWVKVRLPKDLTGKEERTAGIVGSWDIGV